MLPWAIAIVLIAINSIIYDDVKYWNEVCTSTRVSTQTCKHIV